MGRRLNGLRRDEIERADRTNRADCTGRSRAGRRLAPLNLAAGVRYGRAQVSFLRSPDARCDERGLHASTPRREAPLG